MMLGNETDPFYGDNENPYFEVKLYPSDNFLDALHSYVRKHAVHDRVNDARDYISTGQSACAMPSMRFGPAVALGTSSSSISKLQTTTRESLPAT